MISFEELYGRKLNTPMRWDNPTRKSSGWDRISQGNGRINDKNKEKFKGNPRQTENLFS